MIIALAGRRIDKDGQPRRFPPSNVERVQRELTEFFRANAATAVVCAAANGADLLALKAAESMNIRRIVVLPFRKPVFRELSVADAPGNWGDLFDLQMGSLPDHDKIILDFVPESSDAFRKTNLRILDEAMRRGQEDKKQVMTVIVWDGAPKHNDDATAHLRNEALRRGIDVREISTL